jgi:hypothetical protein
MLHKEPHDREIAMLFNQVESTLAPVKENPIGLMAVSYYAVTRTG